MAKIREEDASKAGPKVTPEDLEAEAAILTISEVEETTVQDDETPSGKRRAWLLKFEELGEKALWLNKTQIGYLIAALGDETDDWVGKPIAVEHHEAQFGKQDPVLKVYVSPPESWADLFKQAGLPAPRLKLAPKKVAPKAPAAPVRAAKPGKAKSVTVGKIKRRGRR